MRKRLVSLVCIIVMLCTAVLHVSAEETVSEETQDGFASPKEAAAVYIEGFCEMDYEKMLSACAIEPFVQGYDPEKQAECLRVINPLQLTGTYLPYKDPMSYAINCDRRRSVLSNMILMQFINVMIPGYAGDDKTMGNPIYVEKGDSIAALIEENYGDGRVPEIAFHGEYIPSVLLTNLYHRFLNLRNLARRASVSGMEKSQSLAAVIYIDGSPSLLLLDMGSYDGRWYVADYSTLAMIFALSSNSGGLVNTNYTSSDPDDEYAAVASECRTKIPAVLADPALLSAGEHFDEAVLSLDLQLLRMMGEISKEMGANMVKTTIESALTPEELELLINYWDGTIDY